MSSTAQQARAVDAAPLRFAAQLTRGVRLVAWFATQVFLGYDAI